MNIVHYDYGHDDDGGGGEHEHHVGVFAVECVEEYHEDEDVGVR